MMTLAGLWTYQLILLRNAVYTMLCGQLGMALIMGLWS